MYKRVTRYKLLIVLVITTLVFGNLLTVVARTVENVSKPSISAKEKSPQGEATVAKVSTPVTKVSSQATSEPVSSVGDEEKKQVTFGPYNEENINKKHAYDPFEEKEKDAASKDLGYRKDRLLVKYKDSVTKVKSGTYSVKGKTLSLNKQGIKELEGVLPVKKANGTSSVKKTKMESKLSNWKKAYIIEGKDIDKVIEELKRDENVESVEYDYLREIDGTTSTVVLDDENMNQQWHLDSSGVKQAWEYLKSEGINPGGSRDVVVAVIDTGVDYNHPDLKGNMWINTGEIPGNNIDDDNNGFIDDIYGATTVGNKYAGESGDPADDNGHGTHVAGIIAAQGNNSIGGVGVAYNTRIMAIKAAQSSGVLSSSDVAQAIYYAVDKGADVINMSFGGYIDSTVEKAALEVAFGTSVLVASAGNDGKPNLPHPEGADMYPAAYNWVLGVMAEKPNPSDNGDYLADFSNWDFKAKDSHEYEVIAPGVDIYSTLPNGNYAKWSGTSMAAPVVSGIAALVRSKFSDKDSYSSRFIMGQIAETGEEKQGITYDPKKLPLFYNSVNAFGALTKSPKPNLSVLEHYIFDSPNIASENDGDGVVDAGETVDIAMVIRNHWGKADNVNVEIDTNSHGIPDPYVTILQNSVDYGAVGTFSVDDNGLIYENDVVTGVNLPFKLKIDPKTPNDHIIKLNITLTAKNGFNSQDQTLYSFNDSIQVIVRNGKEIPSIISSDMTLTKDQYWIVPRATLIEKGATVTVEPGTQIQFWSSNPSDPYAQQQQAYLQVEGKFIVNGSADEPVEMFNSSMYSGYEVRIMSTNNVNQYGVIPNEELSGYAEFKYTKITNPNLAVNKIDHSNFTQDLDDRMYKAYIYNGNVNFDYFEGPYISAREVTNTKFERLGFILYPNHNSGSLKLVGTIKNSIFDSCLFNEYSDINGLNDNVFLKNIKRGNDGSYWSSRWINSGYNLNTTVPDNIQIENYRNENNHTYFSTMLKGFDGVSYKQQYQLIKRFAELLGGSIVTINDEQENNFINNNYPMYSIIGLNDLDNEGRYVWANKEQVNYTHWAPGNPIENYSDYDLVYTQYNGWASANQSNIGYNPIIIEIPKISSFEELSAKRDAIISNNELNSFTNNAFLNTWEDPNINHWMRFDTQLPRKYTTYLTNNYWGASNTLIDKAISDYNDDFNKSKIVYEPKLEVAPETAYPFVTDVYVSTESQERATKVGAENIQVHVLFNRDMDQTKQPQVSFGPDMPTTDYTVNGVDGGWTSPRHWVGSMKVSPLTGDGYQFFRVAGAVAADDPWLVTGNDTERFRFEIVTSGTEAMNLQATGGEGKVNLSWTQDDFDTLAGYNVYRSENRLPLDGYTKINKSLIPSDQKSYEDTNVIPGKIYYYQFKVVKTDLAESNASNVASAAPIDTIAPVITHTPIQQAKVGQPVQIFADVTDNVKVSKVTLFYKAAKDTAYKQKEMVTTTNNRYSTTIDGTSVLSPWIDYYIEATDGATKAQYGNQNQPYRIMVSDKATITSVSPAEGLETGGTKVVITGSNFKQGASVLFGQAVASNVVVESENKITAETPAHYPAKVDVTVNNPDGTTGAILGGYTYISEGKEVSIVNVTGNRGDIIDVPIYISDVSGLRSADFKVKFDANLLKVEGVTLGNLTKNFSLASNKNTSGEVQLSMASSTAVGGSGSIAVVSFKVLDSELTTSALTLDQLSFNSGSIKTSPINGTFNLADTYSLTGNVRYYSNYRSVNNVLLELIGTNQQYQGNTDLSGYFALSGIRSGGYSLKPSKTDDINGISSYDASMILQNAVGLIQLNDYQKIAADVDGNGTINALDAAYVLEKSVDLIDLPFPGAGKVWAFTEGEKKYDHLASNVSYQDFTAILLGDVNGDWGEASTNLSSLYKVGQASVQNDGKLTAPVEFNVGEADIYSAKVSIAYDPKEVKLSDVVKSESTKDYSLVYNTKEEGVVEVAIAGTTPIQGNGKLVDLEFEPIDTTVNTADFQLTNGNINDESIVVKSLKANKASNQSVGTKVRWASDALGDGLTYSWVLYRGSIGVGKQNYSKNNAFETTLSKAGTYKVLLMVKDKNGKVVSKFSDDFIINE